MDLLVTSSHRFRSTPDGTVWSTIFGYSFWLRYLDVFDHVRVLARVGPVQSAPPGCVPANGKGVSFVYVPYYIGPWQYLKKALHIRRIATKAVRTRTNDAIIMRVSSRTASIIQPQLRKADRPYGLEVLADPHDVFSPGAIEHPLRAYFQRSSARGLRHMCHEASAIAYVSADSLQRRYPPAPGAYCTNYSSVELGDEAFVSEPREIGQKHGTFTLGFVGSLAHLYKAPDVLIDAVGICVSDGVDVRLIMLGDGEYRSRLETHAANAGLAERVSFLGQVAAGEAVRSKLDQTDLFVLPSRQEGLPRAMIEAMARGLPCIGSTIGGIPELLPEEDTVPPNDVNALADKIREVLTDPERMTRMSARNLENAKAYHDDILRRRRNEFYRYVKQTTEAWIASE